jgi:hypothetical protein
LILLDEIAGGFVVSVLGPVKSARLSATDFIGLRENVSEYAQGQSQ